MDASQFRQQFLPHAQSMYRLAWRLTRDVQAAEDLVQDAFLGLWTKRNRLPKIDNTESYCLTTLRHTFLNQQRRKRLEVVDETAADAGILVEDAQQVLERAERLSSLERFIALLPEEQRRVLTLRDIENRSYAEIAAQLSLSEVNVRVILSRARRTVREQYKKHFRQ
ncbi:MAG: RNA polymerase sigma factor [Alloprevotella sp.]|nr:RNA polymerase sigma factor [Alloprevotella sp.]